MQAEGTSRPAWADIDLGAVSHNAACLAAIAAPAVLCAVVKADGYGHSSVPVAEAALTGGAGELAVALVEEGLVLRRAGVRAPILVLSEPQPEGLEAAFRAGITPSLYTLEGVEAARRAARRAAGEERADPFPVEVKIDSGMHRVGAAPGEAAAVVSAVVEARELSYDGLFTHLASADEVTSSFTTTQLATFEAVRQELGDAGLPAPRRVHAANSAGAIAWPASRYDMVRCGISLYGYPPSDEVAPVLGVELARVGREALRPVLSLKARVTMTRRYEAGERLSYGRTAPLPESALVATVPLGYADGLDRGYQPSGGEVLIRGRRCRLAGAVTMDQVVVDCAPVPDVEVGDEVVLIGSQGEEAITASEWAERLGTISYEVLTRIGPRVPRRYS